MFLSEERSFGLQLKSSFVYQDDYYRTDAKIDVKPKRLSEDYGHVVTLGLTVRNPGTNVMEQWLEGQDSVHLSA